LKGHTVNFGGKAMARLLTAIAISVGLLIGPAAFAQMNQPNPAGGRGTTTAPLDLLGQQDRTFIKEAIGGGMAEVELSKIAEKSENAEVKRFAERMIHDHTTANTELTAIATGLGVEMPKALDTDHQRVRGQLQSMHGNAFDREYMRVMVEDHDQAVKLFRQETSAGHDSQLKQFAQKTLPTIEEHQKMALDLSRRLSETAAR
jgi:putative membrane protein